MAVSTAIARLIVSNGFIEECYLLFLGLMMMGPGPGKVHLPVLMWLFSCCFLSLDFCFSICYLRVQRFSKSIILFLFFCKDTFRVCGLFARWVSSLWLYGLFFCGEGAAERCWAATPSPGWWNIGWLLGGFFCSDGASDYRENCDSDV